MRSRNFFHQILIWQICSATSAAEACCLLYIYSTRSSAAAAVICFQDSYYSRTAFERPPLLQAESGRSRQVAAHRRPRFFLNEVLEICQWWPDKASGMSIFIPQTCFCTQNDQLAMLCLTVTSRSKGRVTDAAVK